MPESLIWYRPPFGPSKIGLPPAVTSPVANGQFQSSALQFNLGTAGDIVLVRAYYQWGLFTPFLNGGLQPLSNGSALIVSTIAFRNEPYVAS